MFYEEIIIVIFNLTTLINYIYFIREMRKKIHFKKSNNTGYQKELEQSTLFL